jgi:hypothetical protein
MNVACMLDFFSGKSPNFINWSTEIRPHLLLNKICGFTSVRSDWQNGSFEHEQYSLPWLLLGSRFCWS